LCAIAIVMTAGVYGIVAGIVKLDDAGLHLSQKNGNNFWRKTQRAVGEVLLNLAPYLMKGLSIVGTIAMFMVGGGILTHGIPGAHDVIHRLSHGAGAVRGIGGMLESILPTLFDVFVGILTGALVLLGVIVAGRFLRMIQGRR
jgi:predicted DNA repair protein MutK